ncbi:phage holin family protein [Synechococcus sp. RSCCF101]|uniref:phage holin family protein n=1 Tax=Synechococcus sp. RSCCF101 TaxID=2511069 RepID=UPI00351A7910
MARKAMGRVAALMGSVMDLHVRLALQEVDREKRRLISGALLLATGGTLMLLALVAAELALLLWMRQSWGWSWLQASLALAVGDLVLAGLMLRVGGAYLSGPYLPETTAGLARTSKVLLGRD